MATFNKRFFTILEQDEDIAPGGETMDLGLEPESDPSMFDNEVPDNPIGKLQDRQRQSAITTLEGWITKVEDFVNYLNGLDDSSINSQINKADCDSIMADIQRSESKKISRLAQDLTSLSESLKQYLQVGRKKQTSAEEV